MAMLAEDSAFSSASFSLQNSDQNYATGKKADKFYEPNPSLGALGGSVFSGGSLYVSVAMFHHP